MGYDVRREKCLVRDKQLYTLNYLSRKTGLPKEVQVYSTSLKDAWKQLDKTEVVKRLKKPLKDLKDLWE